MTCSSPLDVYAATVTAGIAAECAQHAGTHIFEDLVITEVVLDDTGITIHIIGLAERVDTGDVARRLADALTLGRAVVPTVRAVRVPAVSRTALGKHR